MASKGFPLGVKTFLTTVRHLEEAGMKCVLLKATYTYDNTDNFYSDLSAYVVTGATPVALTSPSVSIASSSIVMFDCSNNGLTWENLTDADGIGGAVIYNDTGTASTSPLWAFLDGDNVLAEGGDARVFINESGVSRIAT